MKEDKETMRDETFSISFDENMGGKNYSLKNILKPDALVIVVIFLFSPFTLQILIIFLGLPGKEGHKAQLLHDGFSY